ncbi:MAG: NAD(P)/FAD-dependent oxidoreductase [Woeseiaceae bacterium]|nr:NAD(P)/FAD-dependent oxidoreductase [Woeseiaceae bacterium]
MTHADVVVIGGGAAGLMCAFTAAQRGRDVIVLEGSNRVGKKILMSGGGRCNFTNLWCEPGNFISRNPHFCKSALARYTQHDFVALVERHGIPYHEKTLGQLFCDNSSKDIVAMLLAECAASGVQIETGCSISAVEGGGPFKVSSTSGQYSAAALVIASGGLSIPKMGATGFGYDIARQYGLEVFDTHAALVPFTLTGTLHEIAARLSGVSLPATVTCGDTSFTEDILFTHRGLSGPAILQISSYWRPGQEISVDLLPGQDGHGELLAAKKKQPRSLLRTVLASLLPRALVTELEALLFAGSGSKHVHDLRDEELARIATRLHDWCIKPAATEGYRTAEVTLGGVDTRELSSRTLESKKQPGLFFIGEVVDVTGHLGGFNFQWAWASGHAAGVVV